jgi:hypothetical protein
MLELEYVVLNEVDTDSVFYVHTVSKKAKLNFRLCTISLCKLGMNQN